ncbi:MAG: isoprenylcysteine carboxylmethyltransferase family protein [Rhodospirillales bacterium]|nr:isoprenylcysteine carboxylmethyltransferase family protein [Rhodospirillales bacterium]
MAGSRIETRVPPLVVLALAASFVWLAPDISGAPPLEIPFGGALAAMLAVAGAALAFVAVAGFRRAGTTVDPRYPDRTNALVTAGVYAHTRNPMYVGMAMLLAAFAIVRGDLLGLVAVPAFVAYIDRFQIVPEERALQAQFGDAYAEWCRRVRRWL